MGFGAIATIAGSALASKFLKGKPSTVRQTALRTPEQAEASKGLLKFGQTGSHLGYNAGDAYGGSFGNYDLTDIEKSGQLKLSGLINSGMPGVFGAGTDELQNFLGTDEYDPYNEKGIFSNFKKTFMREQGEATDRLKHNLSFNKNLAGGDTIRQFSNLESRGQEVLGNKLAEAYDTFVGRKLNAIPLALQAGQAEEGINQGRVDSAFKYGGLERSLKNILSDKQYQDFLRQRNEKKEPIAALGQVAGSNTPFGVPSVTSQQPSPWQGLIDMVGQAGGYGLGQQLGRAPTKG